MYRAYIRALIVKIQQHTNKRKILQYKVFTVRPLEL